MRTTTLRMIVFIIAALSRAMPRVAVVIAAAFSHFSNCFDETNDFGSARCTAITAQSVHFQF